MPSQIGKGLGEVDLFQIEGLHLFHGCAVALRTGAGYRFKVDEWMVSARVYLHEAVRDFGRSEIHVRLCAHLFVKNARQLGIEGAVDALDLQAGKEAFCAVRADVMRGPQSCAIRERQLVAAAFAKDMVAPAGIVAAVQNPDGANPAP